MPCTSVRIDPYLSLDVSCTAAPLDEDEDDPPPAAGLLVEEFEQAASAIENTAAAAKNMLRRILDLLPLRKCVVRRYGWESAMVRTASVPEFAWLPVRLSRWRRRASHR
jgi:hypothetical protein